MDIGAQDSDLLKTVSNYDKMKELQAFDDTKAGVKGLLDSGIPKLPNIFIRPPEELSDELNQYRSSDVELPVIDLDGLHRAEQRSGIIDQLKIAAEKWGFFQMINHGIGVSVLDNMINGVQRFHEQDHELKKQYYTRDRERKVKFNSNFDLFKATTANWRDTLGISLPGSYQLDPTELPLACREASMEYIENVKKLGNTLFDLLSEALGLKSNHLRTMECANGCAIACHYYPACPEPEVTLGATKHTDSGFLTILLQNHISGLQVLYENQWVNVHPIPEGLVVNIGDLFQLISNAKFKSNVHRVLANSFGPRISVACFFSGPVTTAKLYSPIEELVSEENPPLYREVILNEYHVRFLSRGLDEKPTIEHYKL